MPTIPAPQSRNDPCPCGSGLRYKQCHGRIAAPAPEPGSESLPADTLARLGFDAHKRNDLDTAERQYRLALAAAPAHAGAAHYLGVVLYQRRRLSEAMQWLDRAVALDPNEPEYHNNRGLALTALMRDTEAVAAHRRALALAPDNVPAWNNLGLALQASGDVTGAVAAYRRGLAVAPDHPQLHWNLALALLLDGDYAQGWPEYEWRLQCAEFHSHRPRYAGPRWSGDDPAGRTLLLTAEQGLGDTLLSLRFAQAVAARGARVLVAVQAPLRTLAATAPGVDAAFAEFDPLPDYDAHVSLMSLPHLLRVAPDSLAASVPYLRADPQRAGDVRDAVAREAGASLKIGVAWAGAGGNTQDARRSMSLATLGPLLDTPGTRWFSLKWDKDAIGAGDAPVRERLVELPYRNDFDGLAALVAELDVVISVDTSIAHLAGALGKPVWVMLAHVPDWRWLLARTSSPWYPTARLYRQAVPGDWSVPVREIGDALRLWRMRR
ncbi:MAG: tetratricopeptide repeat protein [Burkholderiales bacterium]